MIELETVNPISPALMEEVGTYNKQWRRKFSNTFKTNWQYTNFD